MLLIDFSMKDNEDHIIRIRMYEAYQISRSYPNKSISEGLSKGIFELMLHDQTLEISAFPTINNLKTFLEDNSDEVAIVATQ